MARIRTFIPIVLFRVLLDLIYVLFISKNFGASYYLDINNQKLVISYALTIVLSIGVVNIFRTIKAPSSITLILLLVFLVIPIQSVYGLTNQSTLFVINILLAYLMTAIAVTKLPTIKIVGTKGIFGIGLYVLMLITLVVYGYLIATGGLQRINFNLSIVYEVRDEYNEKSFGLLGYLLPWQAHVINLLFLSHAVYFKRKKMIAVALVMQLLIFGMTNFKSFLFAPLLIIVLTIGFKKYKDFNPLSILSKLSMIGIVVSYAYYLIYDDIQYVSTFVRRLFFAPAHIHFNYFNFFINNQYVYLSNSLFSSFLEYPYSVGVTRLVSAYATGKEYSMNSGIYGDAFANFGYAGIWIFSIVLIIVLKVLDSIAQKLPLPISISIIAIPSMALVNSAFFTVMLTHGFLFAMICIWWYSSTKYTKSREL